MPDLVDILDKETRVALFWLGLNEITADPKKFPAILLRTHKSNTSGERFNTNGKIINSKETETFGRYFGL